MTYSLPAYTVVAITISAAFIYVGFVKRDAVMVVTLFAVALVLIYCGKVEV
jgi:hypothetical protein